MWSRWDSSFCMIWCYRKICVYGCNLIFDSSSCIYWKIVKCSVVQIDYIYIILLLKIILVVKIFQIIFDMNFFVKPSCVPISKWANNILEYFFILLQMGINYNVIRFICLWCFQFYYFHTGYVVSLTFLLKGVVSYISPTLQPMLQNSDYSLHRTIFKILK